MQDRFASHRINRQGLVIRGENGAEIVIGLNEASRLLSAVQRSLGSPDEVPGLSERQRGSTRSLHHIVKLG
jgi:hypothetical protein